MSSRYDTRTTTFSPEGRIYQVEYAVEGINKAPSAIGILTTGGIVFATERRQRSELLDVERPQLKDISGEKVYRVDSHIAVAVAGLTADANVLVEKSRDHAQYHRYVYSEPLPAEDLCQSLCDFKQYFTQSGGMRPFGVSLLIGAWDRSFGYQLYNTDPSGNYTAWRAFAIGQHDVAAQSMLKQDWTETLSLEEGILLALKVLGKTMDTMSLDAKRLEVATLVKTKGQDPVFHILADEELLPRIKQSDQQRQKEDEEREAKRKQRKD